MVGAALLIYLWLQVVALLASHPVAELPPGIVPPDWAESFHTKRGGDIHFRADGNFRQEPIRFAVSAVTFLLILVYRVVIDRRFRRHYKKQARDC